MSINPGREKAYIQVHNAFLCEYDSDKFGVIFEYHNVAINQRYYILYMYYSLHCYIMDYVNIYATILYTMLYTKLHYY